MPKVLTKTDWKRQTDGASMECVVIEVRGGIRQKLIINGNEVMETFSERPYKLGQSCDGTIDVCVHALLIKFCRSFGLSYQKLYHEAYPDTENITYGLDYEDETLKEAELQGVEYPEVWDELAFGGLLNSLGEVNNHSLVRVLESLGLFEVPEMV